MWLGHFFFVQQQQQQQQVLSLQNLGRNELES
jgi:hypothetical protein